MFQEGEDIFDLIKRFDPPTDEDIHNLLFAMENNQKTHGEVFHKLNQAIRFLEEERDALMVVVQSYRNAERSLSKTQMFLREANDSVQSLKRRTDDRNAQRGGTK